ncbi:hypothetical protein [Dietzia maris]|uniref:Uncharacterized protein n=1 Tax=Dietzia maris TaxID=37915 RepID=A0A365PAE3_9ACTN|nr:hypothetical protein [Dietzia maris]MCT1434309.1 hypothetical protein [Dietzia maris]MCT1521298.1 hypothetical protein [Dietzia maris]RBA36819.1 hypothetical protein DQ226_08515 [Dietzia maris]
MARTSDRTSARNRARQALAEKQRARRERDERMEAAATRYFAAADAIESARRDAGQAIQALIDEGEPRAEIAELLGITTRDIKAALDALTDDDQDDDSDTGHDEPQGSDVSAGAHRDHHNNDAHRSDEAHVA